MLFDNRIQLAKTTLTGGMLFLMPLVIIILVVGKAIGVTMILAS
jgi:hypothetical protein